jgi:hypothetical protein
MDTFTTYQLLSRDLTRTLKQKSAEPVVALETKYFQSKIATIETVDEFLKDTRVFKYAMRAFGMDDMANAKGFIRKVLNEGVADKNSFANRLNDDRFVAFARAFDFKTYADKTTARAEVGQQTVDKYIQQSLEIDQGNENEGVRLAMYFKRTAPNIRSTYGLLADPAVWKVVKTTFGFPDAMGTADIDKQAKAVEKRLDVKTLQDPAAVDKLIKRFTVMYDVQNNTASSPILQLFAGGGSGVGVDVGMSLLSLKYGG